MRVLSLCDRTGNMVRPWADAGHECVCVDVQNDGRQEGNIEFRYADLFTDTVDGDFDVVFAFPPCTHLAVSGARWFEDKGPEALAEGLKLVEVCRTICDRSGALWMIENPVGRLSTEWRQPDYLFDPFEYGGYLGGENDGYSKRTCLWVGESFVMPEPKPIASEGSRMLRVSPSADRGDVRSVTPAGFARAVFEANNADTPPLTRVCRSCDVEKPLTKFMSDKRKPHGRGYRCKPCRKTDDWRRRGSTVEKPAERTGEPDLRVLSLGAGVQSTTVLLMSAVGELPKLDAAIFADTGWEPAAVYEHLDWLQGVAESAGIPVYRVSVGDLRADSLEGWPTIPFHTHGGIMKRQCTSRYKIIPVRRKIAELCSSRSTLVDQWMGISWDESERMSDSNALYIRNRYPLIDKRMTRQDCLDWAAAHGYPTPPRSSCIGCPFHSNAEWLALGPEELADAVDFERQLRLKPGYEQATLHPKGVLSSVDFSQSLAVGQECGGHCGV